MGDGVETLIDAERGWVAAAASVLTGGRHNRCEAGHAVHAAAHLDIALGGPSPVGDWPPIPRRLGRWFQLLCFDAGMYRDVLGYCPADDEVSRSLLAHGTWEGFETLLALELCCLGPPGVVVDMGCHVGWYSLLAASCGRRVLAVDANLECASMTRESAGLNGWGDLVLAVRGWVGADTEPLPVHDGVRVRLAKVDLEGAEAEALVVLGELLAESRVDWLLVELTPGFGPGWRMALDLCRGLGYEAHVIPDKGHDPEAFAADPLGATLACGPPDPAAEEQVNVLIGKTP